MAVTEHPPAADAAGLHQAAGSTTRPATGIWHWSSADGAKRLAGLDELCRTAAQAGLDYIAFKSHDGAHSRFLTDDQLTQAKQACVNHGLKFVLWQYVYAKAPPADEAAAFAPTVSKFKPEFVFIDVEAEYEAAPRSASREYARSFRAHLPQYPAVIAPLGRADLHSSIDWQAWRDHGFGVAPQAYECDNVKLAPKLCASSFAKFWPLKEQWTIVGLHKGALGQRSGPELAASLNGLPFANISAWYSGEFAVAQLRAIASHHGQHSSSPLPAFSLKTVQQQLRACGFSVEPTGVLDDATREAIRFFKTGWCGMLAFSTIDDKLTPLTRAAIAYAARHNGSLGRKAKDFRYQEFRVDNKGEPRVRRSVGLAAQAYRDRFGPTTIVRSSSSPEHNTAVGGVSDSRHLFPKHFDAIDMSPQDKTPEEVKALGVWTAIGHHKASGKVDHVDLRPGNAQAPSIFVDH